MSDQSTVTVQAQKNAIAGGGVLPFSPPDKATLYQSYMPFVKNGGLYVSTPRRYELGAEVFVLITFPQSNDRLPAVGKVVWVNRTGSVARPSGIGIQFLETPENIIVRDKIETFIAGTPQDMPTFTM